MDSRARRFALSSFLIELRGRLSPEDVGLTSIGHRRGPGLLRNEVAEAAGISPMWYTLLESGNDLHVSPRVLERLATALQLSEAERIYLFALAVDDLPTVERTTADSIGAVGREYFKLRKFAQHSRAASTIQELGDEATKLVYDVAHPVETAYFIKADPSSRQFVFSAQSLAAHATPISQEPFDYASVHDSDHVLVGGGVFAEPDVASTTHAAFADRARTLGSGRYLSAGIKARTFDGAVGYFQRDVGDFSVDERNALGLIAEIVRLAFAAHT